MEVLPGDPAEVMLGRTPGPTPLRRCALSRARWPPPERYVGWVAGMLHGDFGPATLATAVSRTGRGARQVSLPLRCLRLVLTTLIAIPPAGSLPRGGTRRDVGIMGATQLARVPNFWFAMLLVLVFSITLRWLPAGGFPGWWRGPGRPQGADPAGCRAGAAAGLDPRARMRSSLLDTMDDDYVRTARAKGLSGGQALGGHALRNALIPVLTIIGLQFAVPARRHIIIENVFYLPGLGRLVFQAINQRDLIVVKTWSCCWSRRDPGEFPRRPRLRRRRPAVAEARLSRRPPLAAVAGAGFAARALRSQLRDWRRPGCSLALMAAVSLVWTPYDLTAHDIPTSSSRCRPRTGSAPTNTAAIRFR